MKVYSAKETQPGLEEREFPMMVQHKSGSVKIYRSPNRGCDLYITSYHSQGIRQWQTRRDFVEASTQAQEVALKIGDGALNVLTLDGRERFIYERSVQLAAQTGMELDVLVARAVEAFKITGGPNLLVEAARLYEAQHCGVVQTIVPDVVAGLIEDRRNRGRSELYLRDLRVRLEQRFAAAFMVPISSVTTRDIETSLSAVKGGPRTKKNFLTAIGTLLAPSRPRTRARHRVQGFVGQPSFWNMDRGANCAGGLRKGEPTRPERLSMKLKTCLASVAFAAWIPFITLGDPCPPGYYSTNGLLPEVPAPSGYYVSSSGATNPTPASPGTYLDTSAAISANPAPLGHYCPVQGMSSALPAPLGFYLPTI